MIQHTVVFSLQHAAHSAGETAFFEAARKLAAIPGVSHFECLRQTSKKNNFGYGLSMQFNSTVAYDAYNQHPDHIAFIETHWLKEVTAFLEIDYEPF